MRKSQIYSLRQPEVSIAMKELKEWGWVKEREIKRKGKGRPLKNYKLAMDFKDVVKGTVDKKIEGLKKTDKDLQELKKLIG